MISPEYASLSPSTVERLVDGFQNEKNRIRRVEIGDAVVWLKRYGTESGPFWIRIQALLSRIVPLPFLRPSPILGREEMAEREERRIARFSQSGFAVPDVLYRRGDVLLLSDMGQTVTSRLDETHDSAPRVHDNLLIRCAGELGKLHGKGLCHGRPHPRDFTITADGIGFLDFEEEPTAVMPLATAQARDIWLLIFQIGAMAVYRRDTLEKSLAAWRQHAPAEAARQLSKIMKLLKFLLPPARLAEKVVGGSDIRRFVISAAFFSAVDRSSFTAA